MSEMSPIRAVVDCDVYDGGIPFFDYSGDARSAEQVAQISERQNDFRQLIAPLTETECL